MGGAENGLVNLINFMPMDRYRHAIVSLTDVTEFRSRIQRRDVPLFSLQKSEGKDFITYGRLHRVLRSMRPDIVHTRNLGTLECPLVAAVAGVRARIHGEHGRDTYDPDGLNFKYNLLRRALKPFVHQYIAVSNDLAAWLVRTVRVRPDRVTRICNGVDVRRFRPKLGSRHELGPKGFASPVNIVVGTVGRMETIKDPLTLVRAFIHLVNGDVNARQRLRLAIIGDGTLRDETKRLVSTAGLESLAWLPGERNDIPEIMRGLDLFVLPSLREGISNTILEAMASGLPVIATRVGGNPELVEHEKTGILVPPSDPKAIAEAIRGYLHAADKMIDHGQAGRKKAKSEFSIESMINGYVDLYDAILERASNKDPQPH